MRVLLLVALAALPACDATTDADPGDPPSVATFEAEVSGERFRFAVATEAQAAEARAHLASKREGVVSGALARGSGGVNTGYRWHLVPESLHFPDFAIEVCDGRPRSDVEQDVPYWVDTVKQYCPWGARLVREVAR